MPRLIVNVVEDNGIVSVDIESEEALATANEVAYLRTLEGIIKRTHNSPPFQQLLSLQKQKAITKVGVK
ncbi:hypothetical protein ACPV5G_21095 [Photobacterium damselae]|uniref:hypothetical protein n=1 Tax=Photobacterium damselae TaxID=38293 RepID=UPI004067D814